MAPAADPDAVSYRAAQAADATVLGVLGTQVFLDTYATGGIRETVAREVLSSFSTAALQQALANPACTIEMAEFRGHAVGYQHTVMGSTQERVSAHAPEAAQAELLRLYVQEPFTGRGIGKALLQASEQAARRAGAAVLWLTPWVHNHRALRFYAAQGYVDIGATWFRFEGEAHENRVLLKVLEKGLEARMEA